MAVGVGTPMATNQSKFAIGRLLTGCTNYLHPPQFMQGQSLQSFIVTQRDVRVRSRKRYTSYSGVGVPQAGRESAASESNRVADRLLPIPLDCSARFGPLRPKKE